MDEDANRGEFLKLPKLENSIHSYVKWAKKLEAYLKGDTKFTKVVAYAIKGNDNVLQEFEQLPGSGTQVRDQNKMRMEKKDKFETACGAFIGKLLQTISEPVKRMLAMREDYDEIVTADNARGFWEMIREEMMERHGNEANLNQSRKFLQRVKQERTESFYDYAERFMNVVEEIELMGGTTDNSTQRMMFMDGIHERYTRVKPFVVNDSEYDTKSVEELARLMDEKVKRNRMLLPRTFPPSYKQVNRNNSESAPGTIAAMEDQERAGSSNNHRDDRKAKRAKITCWTCGEEGHVQRFCRQQDTLENK